MSRISLALPMCVTEPRDRTCPLLLSLIRTFKEPTVYFRLWRAANQSRIKRPAKLNVRSFRSSSVWRSINGQNKIEVSIWSLLDFRIWTGYRTIITFEIGQDVRIEKNETRSSCGLVLQKAQSRAIYVTRPMWIFLKKLRGQFKPWTSRCP